MNPSVEFANKTGLAYSRMCKPLCQQLHLPQTAFDILMFLANNPGCETAGEICRMRGMKPALVSFHIDRLVGEGFLQRQPVPGDRRKTALVLTEKAAPVIEQGRSMQEQFFARLVAGVDEAQLRAFTATLEAMNQNLDAILEGED